jgi:FtsH-binding integral membrane protein
MAALATFGVTFGISVYACTTKTDFTFFGGLLFSLLSCLIILTLFSFFFEFLNAIICIFGVLLYSLYLLYDTQLLLGKFGVEYSVDDYILASLNIYLDIIQIFLYILEILGRMSDR